MFKYEQIKNQYKRVISLTLLLLASSFIHSQTATGFMFHDINKNEKMDSNKKGISEVCVPHGVEVVQTDSEGKWILPITDDKKLYKQTR